VKNLLFAYEKPNSAAFRLFLSRTAKKEVLAAIQIPSLFALRWLRAAKRFNVKKFVPDKQGKETTKMGFRISSRSVMP